MRRKPERDFLVKRYFKFYQKNACMCKELHGYLQHSACNVLAKLKDTEVSVWQELSARLCWKGELVQPEKTQGMRDWRAAYYYDIWKMMAKQVSLVPISHVLSVNWQGSYATLLRVDTANIDGEKALHLHSHFFTMWAKAYSLLKFICL